MRREGKLINLDDVEAQLFQIANIDKTITDEENSFIQDVMDAISDYDNKLYLSLEDGELSSKERVQLFQARLNIISQAIKTISNDFHLSNDEKLLFKKIQELVPKLEESEHKYKQMKK